MGQIYKYYVIRGSDYYRTVRMGNKQLQGGNYSGGKYGGARSL